MHLSTIYFYTDKDFGDDKFFSDSQAATHALCKTTNKIVEAYLDLNWLTNELLSMNIISETEKCNLTDKWSCKTTADRIEEVLKILKATVKNNGKVFDQFIRILKTGSQREKDIAKILISAYEGDDYI